MSKHTRSQPTLPTARRRIPCESCRLRRRKCDFSSPCHRCRVSERECVYVRHLSPDDLEYEKLMNDNGENDGDWSEELLLLYKQFELLEIEVAKFKAAGLASSAGLASPPESLQDISIDFDDYDYDHDHDSKMLPDCMNSQSHLWLPASPPLSESLASESLASGNESPLDYLLSAPVLPTWADLKETADVLFGTPNTLARTFDWTVTLMRKGLQINTNIRSFQDIVEFLSVSLENALTTDSHFISLEIPRQSEFFQKSKRTPNKFTSTIKLCREVMRTAPESPMFLDFDRPLVSLCITQTLVETLLDIYFTCPNTNFPTLHRETFMTQYYDPAHPTSSAFVNAVCARALCWRCSHITKNELLSNLHSHNLSEMFCSRARHYLEDLFDDVSFSTFAATTFLAICCLISMRFKAAYLYRGHALRLAGILMSTRYSEEAVASSPYPVDPVERESFKRVYWLVSGIEWFCRQLHRCHFNLNFSTIEVIHRTLGLPEPMAEEDEQTRKGVIFIREFLQFLYIAKDSFNAICIMAPNVDAKVEDIATRRIPAQVIRESEEAVMTWYYNLPEDLQTRMEPYLGLTDIEGLNPQRPPLDKYSVYLSLSFHIASIRIFEMFLPELDEDVASKKIKLESIPLPEVGLPWPLKPKMYKRSEIRELPIAEKAQLICTNSAEVITMLFEHLRNYNGCHMFAGSLLKACDIHYRNLRSPDPAVAASAQFNLSYSLRYMKESFSLSGGDDSMRFAYLLKQALSVAADELGVDL